ASDLSSPHIPVKMDSFRHRSTKKPLKVLLIARKCESSSWKRGHTRESLNTAQTGVNPADLLDKLHNPFSQSDCGKKSYFRRFPRKLVIHLCFASSKTRINDG
ncbi:MAG: hypothetical protein ACK56I_27680, partial [bacterium]